jgi:putative nucleotidyltransferase with HDIG domain
LIDLSDLVQISNDLEPLPASTARLAALVSQPDSDMSDIVDTISLDQVLTVTVIRSANSALSNPVSKITTVKGAIIRLGTGTVLAMAMGNNVRGRLSKYPLSDIGIDEKRLWKHSVAAALASECIKRVVKEPIPAETFTAALLHDIGKLILARYLEKDVKKQIDEEVSNEGAHPTEVEFDILGCDHAELGSIIARQWELPESIIHGVAWHHAPQDYIPEPGQSNIMPFVVSLSDGIAKTIGAGIATTDVDMMPEQLTAMERLGIDETVYNTLCDKVSAKLKVVGSCYG